MVDAMVGTAVDAMADTMVRAMVDATVDRAVDAMADTMADVTVYVKVGAMGDGNGCCQWLRSSSSAIKTPWLGSRTSNPQCLP